VILLASAIASDAADRLAVAAKRLERDHGLTILIRALEDGPRSSLPAPDTHLFRVRAAGEDKAGIVAGVCRVLAEHDVNIAELITRARPGPGGSPHYEMDILVEVPGRADMAGLRAALDDVADRLVIDVLLAPA
jgi:glycine cleavage system regulatory protein